MKKLFAILLLIFIGFLLLKAQTPLLGVTTHNIILEKYSNAGSDWYFPANTHYTAYGRFNILSDTNWYIQCSETWLTVIVQMYFIKDGRGYVYNPHSGSAPDIGAYEYRESYAMGSDTAFVQLIAEANVAAPRIAIVAIVGTGVTGQIINVYQKGISPPIIEQHQPQLFNQNMYYINN
jgi:hypothetical protein